VHASRFALTILIAIVTSLGAFSLVGCGGDDQSSQNQSSASQAADSSAATSESSAAEDEGDDEQDNCYGDDLPAVKK
jgi:hypothetical protein